MADIYLTDGDDVYEQAFDSRDTWNHYLGQRGNDLIRLYHGIAAGGAGDDRFEFIPISGEPWRELQLGYWEGSGATVDLEQGWGLDGLGGRDTFTGANRIHGSGNSDWFKGNASDNYFWPNGGQDTLIGGAGNDGITIHWFDPGNGEPGRPTRLSDLKVDVSVDGREATIVPLTGSGFSYTLTDVEFFDLEELTGWKQYRLADFITQQTMARDAVAAGGALRWNAADALGTAATLTYSFVTTAPASGVGA
ncbi:MAG: hypothetical protein MUF16_21300, partial [Burkholderiaceae bacterium]|nr:hypothetical protein [Burkholderiaceae bacterium]